MHHVTLLVEPFYGFLSTKGFNKGVTELSFNTQTSAMGFYDWKQDKSQMATIAAGKTH